MLRRLKRQFILIVMGLVGTVLVAVLGSTFYATLRTQQNLIAGALEHTAYGELNQRPTLGGRPSDDGRMGGMLGLAIEVSSEGIVLEVSDAPVLVNTQTLADVIDRVLEEGELEGQDRSLHVAWKALQLEDGTWRLALVDTSSSDTLLHEQVIKDAHIVCVALAALLAISWWLANWALRPVERAWEQQRRFVADASHELKTPLAVILANTQILQRDITLDDDARRWVDSTADEAAHMKALVGDLLQLARADETVSGEATSALHREDIDLSEMVEAAALEFDAIAFERGCLLEEQVEPGLHVDGDREWVQRLVKILIDNACKYGERGTTVTVRLARMGNKAQLSVRNEGNPIDAEDLPHVFERFYRSDKARKREGEGGFGLGLAIAKGIVDAHGGKISVASSEAEGTTFTVML